MKGTVWTLIAVFVSACLWFVLKDAPRNQPLDRQVWQSDVTATNGLRNPRRNMVGAVQHWVRTDHPSRQVIRAALGAPDGARTEGDSWMVGCYSTFLFCTDGQDLVVEYRNGLATSSHLNDY